jgi:predicted ester cyclase
MSTEENKKLARHWFTDGWNKGDMTVADSVFSPHLTINGVEVGPEGPKKNVARTRRGFPDVTFTVEDQVAEEDRVVTRWLARGTHLGDFDAIAPTGKTFVVPGIVIWRVVDGKVIEDHTVSGEATLPQKLHALLTSSEKA